MGKYIKFIKSGGAAVLTAALLLGAFTPMPVFGASTAPKTDAVAAVERTAARIGAELTALTDSGADGGFTSKVITLSLDQAIARAQEDGLQAESAELSKKADMATAAGYSEKLSTIADALEKYADADINVSATLEASGMTETNEKLFRIQADFAKANIENNYTADMNKIKSDTISTYYGVVQARENLNISKATLELKNQILSNMQKKYIVGVISRIALTQAENSVIEAASNVETAQTAYNSARMGFNLMLGYGLMQTVELTSDITLEEAPAVNLAEAMANAKANRNEITYVEYAMSLQEVMMNSIKVRYPSSSSTYKKQYASYLSTQLATQSVPEQIEIDIRSKYSDLLDKADAVATAENSVALAENAYKIAAVTYNSGLSILTDLKQAEITVKQANLGLMASKSQYNQAVYEFEVAQDVGMERIIF